MAEELKIGTRVKVKDKNFDGTVRFVGLTQFAPGKWVGVELDEPKGKNDGTVEGKTYFHCENNYGLMVRHKQLQVIPEAKTPSHPAQKTSGIPMFSSKRHMPGKKSSPQSSAAASPKVSKHGTPARPLKSDLDHSGKSSRTPPVEVEKELTSSGQSEGLLTSSGPGIIVEPEKLTEVADLNQRLAILQSKRAEDKARIKELEKFKAQYVQMTEYKQRWSESQSDLQQHLKIAKKEAREHQLAKEKAEEEMRDLMDTVEMATLDKEMAEERCESLQTEVEALKERVEELTIELEVIKEEINEGGVEGAAANAEYKQMEQQNSRLKEALLRLRDLSAQEKLEHQRVVKDLEKTGAALVIVKDQKDKLAKDLEEADVIIDDLKDQVDAALGAEEMVEKLTDNNLELEEKLATVAETVADLEMLRDLSEEQEEIRMEVEHDLREELDMSLNSVRQMEQKLDAAQETIVDQQQTIGKFRELVRNLNSDLKDLRDSKWEKGVSEEKIEAESKTSIANLNVQLKSAVKAQARTIDFELRKLETQQAAEQINHLISFMPSTFLITGGDYDALLVLMLLPRMSFKVELIIDQLKQQYNFDELMGSMSKLTGTQLDKLTFVSKVIVKLLHLNLLVNRAHSILKECDVHLYRQMGGVRDDLAIHEKALDVLIDLLKKEQLDESVPLGNLEKAISHFESLLERRLRLEEGARIPSSCSSHLLSQMLLLTSSCDVITLQLLHIRSVVPEGSLFAVQLKEMETINGDVRQSAKKVRRRASSGQSGKLLVYDQAVASTVEKLVQKHVLYAEAIGSLQAKTSQKASSLLEGEKLGPGEIDGFIQDVVASRVLLEFTSEISSLSEPKEMFGKGLNITLSGLDNFLSALSEGKYDVLDTKIKIELPIVVRSRSVKAELSDVEGLGFKLEERQQDILQLKKSLKLKAQELSESNVKIGLLEKKLESSDMEMKRLADAEKDEVKKLKDQLERQKDDFRQTIFVLQGDIEALEAEKNSLENKLKLGPTSYPEGKHGQKVRMVAPPTSSSSPFLSRKMPSSALELEFGGSSAEGSADQSALLMARIESLSKALGFSINENFRLKTKIARAQLNSLAPLKVPHRLVVRPGKEEDKEVPDSGYHTDQEKDVLKRTAILIQDLKKMCLHDVVAAQKVPAVQGKAKDGSDESSSVNSARERLSNNIVGMYEIQRRVKALHEDAQKVIRSQCPGSSVDASVASFNSPQFSKVLAETKLTNPVAVIRLMSGPQSSARSNMNHRILLSPSQFYALHETVVT